MKTTFKIAESADTEILMKFIREFCEFDEHPFDEFDIRTTLARLLQDDSLGRVWLIKHKGEAIGYIILTFGYSLEYRGRDAFIDEFYICASHRRQGIGRSAIQFIERVCPSLQIKAVHLEVERKNTAAQSFYHQVGFKDGERYLMTKRIANRVGK
jgi:GNAT superfamily N-acetyltransferase